MKYFYLLFSLFFTISLANAQDRYEDGIKRMEANAEITAKWFKATFNMSSEQAEEIKCLLTIPEQTIKDLIEMDDNGRAFLQKRIMEDIEAGYFDVFTEDQLATYNLTEDNFKERLQSMDFNTYRDKEMTARGF